jgi:hypothetical protein
MFDIYTGLFIAQLVTPEEIEFPREAKCFRTIPSRGTNRRHEQALQIPRRERVQVHCIYSFRIVPQGLWDGHA